MTADPDSSPVAIVTGASSGIGEATARMLAAADYTVVLVARRRDELERVANDIAGAGQKALAIGADLSKPTTPEQVATMVSENLGRIDVLVNSAGVAKLSSVIDGKPEDWEEMWKINVLGLARMSSAVIGHFPASGGHIVHLSSLSGHRVPPSGGFYAPTKHAVRAHAEALRSELRGRGNATRVTCISPGFVDTPLAEEYLGSAGKTVESLGYSVLEPEDIARAVVHAVQSPQGVEINDVLMRPSGQKT